MAPRIGESAAKDLDSSRAKSDSTNGHSTEVQVSALACQAQERDRKKSETALRNAIGCATRWMGLAPSPVPRIVMLP
jgi:hypothetical protein